MDKDEFTTLQDDGCPNCPESYVEHIEERVAVSLEIIKHKIVRIIKELCYVS